ncbi:MAG: hypothetical protein WBP59_11035, partial [Ilumatobacteraceae bacterium]
MKAPTRLVALAATIFLSVLVVVTPATTSVVYAQAAAAITATKSAPGSVLAGETVSYTIGASNPGPEVLYNVTLRDVLPLGVTYAGPTTPAEIGEPQIIVTQVPDPADPAILMDQQTLIWSNVGDLQVSDSLGLSFAVNLNEAPDVAQPNLPVYQVGSSVQNASDAYGSTDPRTLPGFDADGLPIVNAAVTASSSASVATLLTAIQVRKSEPSPEGELLRGVHRQTTVYRLEVEATGLDAVNGVTLVDYIPAALEFLGCGGEDNSTGSSRPEYPGAPLLDVTPTPADCVFPDSVDTVVNPPANGTTVYPPGVYTRVEWDLGDVAAGSTIVRTYAAGIPLRSNVAFPGGTATTGIQASNLDNNTGPSTRESDSEQAVTNIARVNGTYAGTTESGVQTVSDDDRVSRAIEDIRVRKSIVTPDPNVFSTGEDATYQIVIDTSEYVSASGIELTDVMPNGLCPYSDIAYVSSGTGCGTALDPSDPRSPSVDPPSANPTFGMSSVTPTGSGGFTVVFDPLTVPADESTTITYTALMRNLYEDGPNNDRPPVSGDSFTNNINSSGITTPIPDTGETGEVADVSDGSSATLVSGGVAIDKRIRPRGSFGSFLGPGDDCPAGPGETDQYIDPESLPLGERAEELAFRLGDQVCFLLRVDFDPTIRTRNPVITDFLPTGMRYIASSMIETAENTVVETNIGAAEVPADGPLVITPGVVDPLVGGSDLYVGLPSDDGSNVPKVFEVVFKAEVVAVPDNDVPQITGNLMKMRTESTEGQARSYRDRTGMAIVPAPPVSILKGVEHVDVPLFTAAGPDEDDKEVREGSTVTFRLDVTNDGSALTFNDYSTRDFEIWDVLPAGIRCAQISNISYLGAADGTPVVDPLPAGQSAVRVCTDPGDADQPTFVGNGQRSAIRWQFPVAVEDPNTPEADNEFWEIDAGQTRTLTFDMEIPSPTSISTTFLNTGAVRSFQAFTNVLDDTADYYPANNIDSSLTSDDYTADAASDVSDVYTPGAVVTKSGVTEVDESGNNLLVQAVPGERITYTIGVNLPSDVSVFDAALRDILPSQVDIVSGSPVGNFYANWPTDPTAAALPAGFVLDPVTAELTFPDGVDGYTNDTANTQRFEVVFDVIVRPSITGQPSILNRARFVSNDSQGGTPVTTDDATSNNSVVQANPSILKSNDTDSGVVTAGQTVRYTVTPRNLNASRPPLHDAFVTDCLPAGLGFVDTVPAGGLAAGFPQAGDPVANGCAAGTEAIRWDVGTINGGATVPLVYDVEVEDTAVGGASYQNTASVVGSSLDNGVNDPTVERVYTPNPVSNTVIVPGSGTTKTVDKTEATIGELVTYTVRSTAPRDVNFYQAAVRDLVPSSLDPATLRLVSTDCQSLGNSTVPSPPPCDATTGTLLPSVAVPGGLLVATYYGDIAAVPYDRLVTTVYEARVADIPANDAGDLIVNEAQSVWDLVDAPTVPTSADYPWENEGPVDTAETRIVEPMLSLEKSVSNATPEPLDIFTYTISLNNASGANVSAAYNATVVDQIPAGLIVDPASIDPAPSQFDPPSGLVSGRIEWDPTDLPGPNEPGSSIELTYQATLAESDLIDGSALTNVADLETYEGLDAGVGAGDNRRVYEGNTDDATVTPDFPLLETVKTATDGEPTYIGADYTWSVEVTNVGGGRATGVGIIDTLPENWTYVPGSSELVQVSGPPAVAIADPIVGAPCPAGALCWV